MAPPHILLVKLSDEPKESRKLLEVRETKALKISSFEPTFFYSNSVKMTFEPRKVLYTYEKIHRYETSPSEPIQHEVELMK